MEKKNKNPDSVGILDFSPNQRFGRNRDKIWQLGKILTFLLIISFVIANFFVSANFFVLAQDSDEVGELNDKIGDKRKEIEILQKEIDAYAEQIKIKQKEVKGLKSQVALLENQIAKLNLDITATEKRIEETNLEIQSLNLKIKEVENQIADKKNKISEYLRLIYRTDQISYLEVILINNSFSDFFDQIKYTEEIHGNLKNALVGLKNDKNDLETQKKTWEEKAKLEDELKQKLQQQKSELVEKNSAQGILLLQARLTEKQYQSYLYQLQLEQQQINSDIVTLEKTVRQKLEQRETAERFKGFGPARLSWPVSPDKGITAYFHDPDYPFRYIFEHPAIDIRASQGTLVKAAESGYIARVKFNNNTSYAYIMIIHNDGLSTVYGHLSAVSVKEDDFVSQGQTIGQSGGIPGSKGAGNLSTGPHLHFEVRLNGIPINPLEYLP